MPTELEELVEFLHHGNTQIRQTAASTLVPFSKLQPSLFSSNEFTPIKDLQLLIRDYTPIAENATTILINLSSSPSLGLQSKLTDPTFITSLLSFLLRPTTPKTKNNGATPHSLSLLLSNLTKLSQLESLITLRLDVPKKDSLAISSLLDLYNAEPSSSDESGNVDHLAYTFANLTHYPAFQTYLLTPSTSTELEPLSILLPHTTSPSPIRRLGTALLLRNLALASPSPEQLLRPGQSILPSILLPLCSADQSGISDEEMEKLPEECQLLGSDHQEEKDRETLEALVETIYLLAARGGREVRGVLRDEGTYVVIREGHLRWTEGEGNGKVVELCEKVVDLLMGDEDEGGKTGEDRVETIGGKKRVEEVEEDDEGDEAIVPIF